MRRSMLATRGRAAPPRRLAQRMRHEAAGRARWSHAGRAGAVAAMLALVVAWPRLTPPAPRLPGDAGIPVATPDPPAEPGETARRDAAERRAAPSRAEQRDAARGRAAKRRAARRRAAR